MCSYLDNNKTAANADKHVFRKNYACLGNEWQRKTRLKGTSTLIILFIRKAFTSVKTQAVSRVIGHWKCNTYPSTYFQVKCKH